jgi:hypothetical protein
MKLSEANFAKQYGVDAQQVAFSGDAVWLRSGMAAIANGCTFHTVKQFDERDRRTLGTEGVWGKTGCRKVARPCDCWRLWIAREMRISDIITHLFDWHVMVKKN